MSEQNLELVWQVYEAMNDNDPARFDELADPDAEWISDPRLGMKPHRGRDEVVRFFTDQAEMFNEMRIEVERLTDSGDKVLAFIRVNGRGGASGAEVEISIGHVWTIRDGRVARGEGFGDRDEAVRAAGLSR
jgi:uncharacterized protein